MTNQSEELYFAYGSNLNPARMNLRKALFTSRVPAILNGYKLGFSCKGPDVGFGAANIIPEPGCVVHGALYALKEGGLEILDEFEGVAAEHYARHKVLVEVGDKEMEVTTYVVTKKCYLEGLKPKQEYLDHLLAGEDILPRDYFEWIKTFSEKTSKM